MVRDESISRSLMLLSFAASFLMLTSHWWAIPPAPDESHRLNSLDLSEAEPVVTQPATPAPPSPQPTPAPRRLRSWLNPNPPLKAGYAYLVVDLSDRQVYLYQVGRLKAKYPIAIGQSGWETPTGQFQVIHMQPMPTWRHPITKAIVPPGSANPLGTRWIGFWTDGEYELGFHGTNTPDAIGEAISHGCIRMFNADVEALYDQIGIGTPVIVHP